MATLTLGGRTYAVAPFRLRELRRAAPFLDRLAARGGPVQGLAGLAEAAADMLGVVAAGLDEGALATLEAELRLEDLEALRTAFEAVLTEAGLKGGAEAAVPGEPRGA